MFAADGTLSSEPQEGKEQPFRLRPYPHHGRRKKSELTEWFFLFLLREDRCLEHGGHAYGQESCKTETDADQKDTI